MGCCEGSPLIVLDTHVWLWWCNGSKKLSRRAAAEIGRQDSIAVSAMSCWELAMLEQQNRIRFDRGAAAWLRQALAGERTTLLPVTAEIATRAGHMHATVPEPADALIYATAVEHSAQLVTRDRLLQELDPARVVW